MRLKFSDSDRMRLSEAITRAESGTNGEIVPVVLERSDSYDVAPWKAAALFGVAAMALVVITLRFYQGWGLMWLHSGWGPVIVATVAGTLGWLLAAYVPPLTRLFAGEERLLAATHRRAMQAFLEHEIFATRERTGILLFVSLLEHRIEVLGDTGINAVVDPDEWVDVIEAVRRGLAEGRLTDGLVDAIALCGSLLEEKGFWAGEENPNELPNEIGG
jgi:putative membrane protein